MCRVHRRWGDCSSSHQHSPHLALSLSSMCKMREFSSCQRHFKQRASEKRNREGDIMPSRNSPSSWTPLAPIWRVNTSQAPGLPIPLTSSLVSGVHCLSRGARGTLRPGGHAVSSQLSTCTMDLWNSALQEFFLQYYDLGGSLSVSWHNLFLRYFSGWICSFLFEVPEEGWLSYKQKSCSQSSLPDYPVISYYSKMYIRTSYVQSLLTFLLILSHWVITICWGYHHEACITTRKLTLKGSGRTSEKAHSHRIQIQPVWLHCLQRVALHPMSHVLVSLFVSPGLQFPNGTHTKVVHKEVVFTQSLHRDILVKC